MKKPDKLCGKFSMNKIDPLDLRFLSEEMTRLGISKKSIADHTNLAPRTVYAHLDEGNNYFNLPIHEALIERIRFAIQLSLKSAQTEISRCYEVEQNLKRIEKYR